MSSSRSESQPRQARVSARTYAVQKRATSSRVSLLSNITSQSKESAGSSSTITQESYSKSERRSKRRSAQTSKRRSTTKASSSMQAERRLRERVRHSASDIDVFSYLVEDINDPSEKSTSWEAERDRTRRRASVQDDPDETETKSVRSRLSDSGVSMNDSGYDSTSPTIYMKPRLGSLPENVFVEDYERLERQPDEDSRKVGQHYPQSQTGRLHHYQHDFRSSPLPPQTCPVSVESSPHKLSAVQPPLSGYDLLASRLGHGDDESSPMPAIYRRFTTLNHRLLLQLQDEISELEAELRRFDDADSFHRQDLPASRRADWATGRLELLSKIHMKLEHYHGAVLRMQKVKSATFGARLKDVQVYRTWLVEHRPLQEAEMKFLDDETDLMSLDGILQPRHVEASPHQQYSFTMLSTLTSVWLITCVPSICARWATLILLVCFTIGTQPFTLSSFDLAEAFKRAKSIAITLAFCMIVTLIC